MFFAQLKCAYDQPDGRRGSKASSSYVIQDPNSPDRLTNDDEELPNTTREEVKQLGVERKDQCDREEDTKSQNPPSNRASVNSGPEVYPGEIASREASQDGLREAPMFAGPIVNSTPEAAGPSEAAPDKSDPLAEVAKSVAFFFKFKKFLIL